MSAVTLTEWGNLLYPQVYIWWCGNVRFFKEHHQTACKVSSCLPPTVLDSFLHHCPNPFFFPPYCDSSWSKNAMTGAPPGSRLTAWSLVGSPATSARSQEVGSVQPEHLYMHGCDGCSDWTRGSSEIEEVLKSARWKIAVYQLQRHSTKIWNRGEHRVENYVLATYPPFLAERTVDCVEMCVCTSTHPRCVHQREMEKLKML